MAYKKSNPNGQAAMAASEPVVIASDQSAVPVSGTVTANIGTVATLATAAKQDTGNTSVASIDTKTPALGQALAAASVPVILPSATVTTLTPPAAITNFANETGGNLAAIKAKTDNIPAQGQALAAASLPVVLTAAQITTLTPPTTVIANMGTVTADPFGANADAASASGSISAKLRGIATALGITALDLGTGTGGTRTLRNFQDTAQFVGGTGTDTSATQRVSLATNVALPAGTNLMGKVGIDQTTPGTTNAVQDIPATAGGLSKFHLVGAASDNATNVKASAGQVYSITAFNLNASPRYLKFHNTAGTPTAGTAITDTFLIPGNTAGAGLVLNVDKGIAFSTGIGITIVTGIADNNTTAISASEVVVNIYYK